MITIEQMIDKLERQKRLRLHLLDDDGAYMDAILSTLRLYTELEADARRLDYLEFNMQTFTTTDDRVEFAVPKWSNLRAAIDAAGGERK